MFGCLFSLQPMELLCICVWAVWEASPLESGYVNSTRCTLLMKCHVALLCQSRKKGLILPMSMTMNNNTSSGNSSFIYETIIILVNKKLTVFSPEGLMCSTWKPMSCQQQICLLRELWTWLTNAFQELQSPFWGYRSYAFFIQETWSISQHIIYTVASHISFW